MSRCVEWGKDAQGLYYVEVLVDKSACRFLINDVCSNEGSAENLGCLFPSDEECKACPFFTAETDEDLKELKEGRVYRDET